LLLFVLCFFISSCDDGSVDQVSFTFNDSLAGVCRSGTSAFFIQKTQDNRAIIIQVPESNFQNRLTADLPVQPQPLTINGSSIRLIYREYSGPITGTILCSVIPEAEPVVTREREATAGTLRITTTAIKTEPNADGVTQITHFLHTLTFSDLTFDLGEGNTQVNEQIAPIQFQTPATSFTNFSGLPGVESCTNDNTVLFKYQVDQSLVLDLSDADFATLFSSEPGPKSVLFSDSTRLKHTFYNTTINTLSDTYFCSNPLPALPPVIEEFQAVNGILNQSGIIQVTTLPSTNGFKHTIVLLNVRLANGSLTRQLGNSFIFGEFETSN